VVYEQTSSGLTIYDPKYAVNCLVTTGGLRDLCASGSDPVSRNLEVKEEMEKQSKAWTVLKGYG